MKMTKEAAKLKAEKRNATMLARYGVKSFTDVSKVKQTKKERYGDENYNNNSKHIETCLERYGVEHHNKNPDIAAKISYTKSLPETQEKYEKTMEERYGYKSTNLVPEIREKYTNTLLKHYGVTNPLKNKDIYNKHIETMKINGTMNTSKPEEDYYKYLCDKYGEDDIIRQYRDDRYSYNGKCFNCDFYIKSEDRFIELNYHPSHGGHPFDENNEEDLKILENLKNNKSEWNDLIIDVWTNRDVLKKKVAEQNKLNIDILY